MLFVAAVHFVQEIYEAPEASSTPAGGLGLTVEQNHHCLAPFSEAALNQPSPGAAAAAHKPRMRWTPELHECFVEAVNKLDGAESE